MDEDICDLQGPQFRIDQVISKLNQVEKILEDKLDKHQVSTDKQLKHLEEGMDYLARGLKTIHSVVQQQSTTGISTSQPSDKRYPLLDDRP